jgi:hypothetical protein
MTIRTNAQALASALFSLQGLESHFAAVGFADEAARAAHIEWARDIHESRIAQIMGELPSGSGFDNGTTLADESTPSRLIFQTAFHHMDESGMYDGWTEHRVTVTPSLVWGIELRIGGRNRRDIKDYIADMFRDVLEREAADIAAPPSPGAPPVKPPADPSAPALSVALEAGVMLARRVAANWESGDLALAVGALEEWADDTADAFPTLDYSDGLEDDESDADGLEDDGRHAFQVVATGPDGRDYLAAFYPVEVATAALAHDAAESKASALRAEPGAGAVYVREVNAPDE